MFLIFISVVLADNAGVIVNPKGEMKGIVFQATSKYHFCKCQPIKHCNMHDILTSDLKC